MPTQDVRSSFHCQTLAKRAGLALALLASTELISGLGLNAARQAFGAPPEKAQAIAGSDDEAFAYNALQRLKQIGIALHNYHNTNRAFPPAVLLGPDGATPHSWRVALLPYLENNGKQLYDRYRLNEPWDSEHNRKLIAEGAKFYRIGDDPGNESSSYYLLLGPGAGFDRNNPTKIRAITDGTSRTIAVVEAERPIPWTKPEDLEFSLDKPLPKLGGHFEAGFLCLLLDASTHFMPDDTSEDILRAMISKSGRELLATDASDRWILQKQN